MFDPTREVPSLELCKKLKELGYPQDEGGWYWVKKDDKWRVIYIKSPYNSSIKKRLSYQLNDIIKAPTLVEMEKWFLKTNTPPNTYAEALIWLKEKGYITFKKEEI